MSLIEIHQKQKVALEKSLAELYEEMPDASIGTAGDYRNKIKHLERQLGDIDSKISIEAKQTVFNNIEPEKNVRIIKMFLASSAELKDEREQFEIFISRENNTLINRNSFIRLIVWEDFINVMSKTRLQDEYNKTIKECDLFLSLFFTKAGMFTEEEFSTAFGQFKENGKPLIYTYFKNISNDIDSSSQEEKSLLNFKLKLKNLGHFYTSYNDIYDLKYQFKMQLEKIIPLLKLKYD